MNTPEQIQELSDPRTSAKDTGAAWGGVFARVVCGAVGEALLRGQITATDTRYLSGTHDLSLRAPAATLSSVTTAHFESEGPYPCTRCSPSDRSPVRFQGQ